LLVAGSEYINMGQLYYGSYFYADRAVINHDFLSILEIIRIYGFGEICPVDSENRAPL